MELMRNEGIKSYETKYHKFRLDDIPNDFIQIRNEMTWGSIDGNKRLLKNISDSHLENIIDWIKKRPSSYKINTLKIMLNESKFRKLNYIIVPEYRS